MLKKTLVIAMCLALVLSLAACGGGEKAKTALELYNAASKLAAEAKSMSADYDMQMEMVMDGMTLEMPMTGSIDMIMNEGTLDTIEYAMDLDTELMGIEMKTTNYLKDGVAYIHTEAEGEVIEYKSPATQEYADSISQFNEYQEFTEDMVKSQSIEGGVANLVIDGAKAKDFAMSVAGDELAGTLGEGDDFTISDMTISFTVDDAGMFKDIVMIFVMDMTIEGMAVQATIDMDMEYTGYNNIEAIDFPDFSAYEEV